MGRLDGRVALITGAGVGNGRRAAVLFAREGAKVAVAEFADDAGRDAVAEITAAGGDALFVHVDVSEPDSVEAAVRATVARFGKLDTLYNNVGGTNPKDGPVTDVPIDVFWGSLKRDLFGTFLGCRFAIPEIIKAGGGAVINTASLVALIGKPAPSQISYTAAKGAIVSMTRAMAVQYAPQKVRVNAIADIFASGMVWAPDRRWAHEVIDQVAEFPNGEFDDIVDTVSQALIRFRKGGMVQLKSDWADEEVQQRRRTVAYY